MVRVQIREQGSILCTSGSAPAGFSTLDRTIAVEICAWLYVACDLIGETENPAWARAPVFLSEWWPCRRSVFCLLSRQTMRTPPRPHARLIYESFFDFGWRPVCSPHCHPLWTQLGEGCQRCIPPSLRSYSPPSITPLPQSLPVSSIPCSVCLLFYARSS